MDKIFYYILYISAFASTGMVIQVYYKEIFEFIFEIIALVLPNKLREKFTNSDLYSNILSRCNSILKSKKINDKIKKKLLSKPLINLLSKNNILKIISNINSDELKYNILLNKNIYTQKI